MSIGRDKSRPGMMSRLHALDQRTSRQDGGQREDDKAQPQEHAAAPASRSIDGEQ
jgi:hypothetical protein